MKPPQEVNLEVELKTQRDHHIQPRGFGKTSQVMTVTLTFGVY